MRRFAAVGLLIHLHWHSKGPNWKPSQISSFTYMLQGFRQISATVAPFRLLSLVLGSLESADQARGKQCAVSCTRTWSRAILLCKNLSHRLPEKTNFWSDWPFRLLFFCLKAVSGLIKNITWTMHDCARVLRKIIKSYNSLTCWRWVKAFCLAVNVLKDEFTTFQNVLI